MGIGGYYMIKVNYSLVIFVISLFIGFMIAPIVQMSNIGSQLTEALAGLDRTEEIMIMKLKKINRKNHSVEEYKRRY